MLVHNSMLTCGGCFLEISGKTACIFFYFFFLAKVHIEYPFSPVEDLNVW